VGIARAKVNPLPLIKGKVSVPTLSVNDIVYAMGNPDSALQLNATVDNVYAWDASVRLSDMDINLLKGEVDGVRIKMAIKNDTTTVQSDTVQPSPLTVNADNLVISNLDFAMSLEGTIDSLGTHVGKANLVKGQFDLLKSDIHAGALIIDSISAAYIYPAVTTSTSTPTDTVTSASAPWTVNVDKISITGQSALYALNGAVPTHGFDMNYICVSDIKIDIDSLYNRGTSIRVPIKRIEATERCGLPLLANGLFEMDSTEMRVDSLTVATSFSSINLTGVMGVGDLTTTPNLPLHLNAHASIAPIDVKRALPAMSQFVSALPPYANLEAQANINGTTSSLSINEISAALPGILTLGADGFVESPFNMDFASGNINLRGHIISGKTVQRMVMDPKTAKSSGIVIPRINLNGNVSLRSGTIDTRLRARTDTGTIALDARWNGKHEFYKADITAKDFPIEAIMPGLGMRDLSANLKLEGNGYDSFKPDTKIDASIDIVNLIYNRATLKNVQALATLSNGQGEVMLKSANRAATFQIVASGNLSPNPYYWTIRGDIPSIDLYALGITTDPTTITLSFDCNAGVDVDNHTLDAQLRFNNIMANMGENATYSTKGLIVDFSGTDSLTRAKITDHSLVLDFVSPLPVDSVASQFSVASDTIIEFMHRQRTDIPLIQSILPKFKLTFTSGASGNILTNALQKSGMSFKSINARLTNDSLINMNAQLLKLKSGSVKLDTISLAINQIGKYLTLNTDVNNARGTWDEMAHLNLTGYLVDAKAGLFFKQSNISNKTGYSIGMVAQTADSVVTINLVPYNPVIGYKDWTVNSDNYITYNLIHRHVDADLHMHSNESSIALFTDHNDSIRGQEDINLIVKDIHIADWLSINPFAPPMKGDLSVNLKVGQRENHVFTGNGIISLDDFYYGRERVGSFKIDADISTNAKGTLNADLALMVDSIKTITVRGALNDSTAASPFLLDFRMIHFPLKVVNPFLPSGTATLSGMLNGNMEITGSSADPKFNGSIEFDSTTMKVTMLGTTFKFAETKIPVDSNIVYFNNYTIQGVNQNPLSINGEVDLRRIWAPMIDLVLKADNMQIVNSTKASKGADVYGKAFINVDATVQGELSDLDIDAALTVLSSTNVTYVMTDAQSTLKSRDIGDMVRFVNFADSSTLVVDTIPDNTSSMNLNALLTIQPGSTLNVDLSTDGKNRVTLQTNGTLDYSVNSMNDSRFTGRLNINSGFVRYSPPLMSEKVFNFQEGSFVAFNGDMMNPILNIHAVDNLKANVTQTGQNSRLITFNILLDITGTLDEMNVKFDLETNDDITIQNELQSMSADQRANQAMNLLLYNVYTGPGTKADSNIGGNALYSFLESQLNSWAANNIKGVDISFGINQYDQTTNGATSTTTSYSYRVSKSLFNDRFKIVVGGNYTDDNDPDQNIAEDLINDISFEYLLNQNGTMLVRIFRHTGFESILEGEITQTGVGFVYKRKIQNLGEMFKPFRRHSRSVPQLPQQGQVLNQLPTSSSDNENKK
ncbi:MAG: translocation/assembly module TamB, partial [Muribaculaceae bacterium]|nr:translocation/assembly module TamB [Muribaculaceae bacterium]